VLGSIIFLLGTVINMAIEQKFTLDEHNDSYPGGGNSINNSFA
jgi:hypothetical protein